MQASDIKKEYFSHAQALKANLRSLLLGSLSLVFVDAMVFSLPLLVKWMIDILRGGQIPSWVPFYWKNLSSFQFILVIAGIYLAFMALIAVGRFYWRVFLIWYSFAWFHEIRCELFKHIQNLHRDFFKNKKVGDLISALTSDTENIRLTMSIGALMIIDASICFLIFPIVLWNLNSTLAMLIVPPLFLASIGSLLVSAKLSPMYERLQNVTGALSGKAYEMMSGVRMIKAFRREESLHKDFSEKSRELRDASLRVAKFQIFFVPGLEFALSLATAAALILGGMKVLKNELALSSFIAFQLYLAQLDWPMMAIGWFIQIFRASKASERRLFDIVETQNPMLGSHESRKISSKALTETCDLSYRYENGEQFVVKDLNLKLEAGSWMGLTGRVGTGKTTLLELLSRQRDPSSGDVFFRGKSLKGLSLQEIRDQILYVPQEAFTFSKSLRFNLTLGLKSSVPDSNLWELLDDLCFHRSEMESRGGLETRLGERGLSLSGGQRQRVSLGRALMRQRKLYLLDDLFSQVDTETEGKLFLALKKYLPEDAAVVLVSQRLQTLRQMDRILVMKQGACELFENPSVAEKENEFLQSLYRLQSEQAVWV